MERLSQEFLNALARGCTFDLDGFLISPNARFSLRGMPVRASVCPRAAIL